MIDTLRGIRLVVSASLRAAPRLALFAFSLEPLGAGASALTGLYLKWVIDGARASNTGAVAESAFGLGLTMAASVVLGSVGWRLRTKLLEKTGAWLDARILELSSALPHIDHTERPEYHDRIQMLQGSGLGNSLFAIIPGLAAAVRLGVSATLLTSIDPLLALLPAFAVPAVALGIRSQNIQHDAHERVAHRWRRAAGLYGLTIDAGPAKELRVFGLCDDVRTRHRRERGAGATELARANLSGAALTAIGWACFSVGYIGMLALVAVRVQAGDATIGDLMLAITIVAQLQSSIYELAYEIRDLYGRLRSARHFLWLEDLVRTAPRGGDLTPPDTLRDGIAFQDVCFTYPGTNTEVLTDACFFLPAGAMVALVGDNGAGKTTLVKLLCGFYEPASGSITVDGEDLHNFDLATWRARMATGFQDYCRFELLASQTIGVGDLPRIESHAAIRQSLERAGAPDLPEAMASGLATQLGRSFDDGAELSMGQWQKLALARAFMRDSPLVVVLDEPTSSLDAPTEHALFRRYSLVARQRRAEGAITVVVSHRFSTVRMADLIIVIEGGRVEEVGSHAELMSRNGLYAELFTLQAAGYR